MRSIKKGDFVKVISSERYENIRNGVVYEVLDTLGSAIIINTDIPEDAISVDREDIILIENKAGC